MLFRALPDLPVTTSAAQELVDITDDLDRLVRDAGPIDGLVHVWCPHTSAGLAVTELEDGLHVDLAALLEELAPRARPWAHDDRARRYQNLDDDRVNGWSHMRALLVTQPGLTLPIRDGALAIGRWQRLFLVELDGGRARRLVVSAWGNAARQQ